MPHAKRMIVLPSMTPGTQRRIVYHRFGKAGARPKAYLQAAIHANELPGAMALHHLMPMLGEADRADFAALPFDEDAYLGHLGLPALVGEVGYTTLERRGGRPTRRA